MVEIPNLQYRGTGVDANLLRSVLEEMATEIAQVAAGAGEGAIDGGSA